jgi:hypothetical protein
MPLGFLLRVMDESIAHLVRVAELPQHPHFRSWLADGTRVEGLERYSLALPLYAVRVVLVAI